MTGRNGDDIFETLQAIDPEILTQVARQSLNAPDLRLADWSVAPLRHEKVLETTGGLYRFQGNGWIGSQKMPWSAILKIVLRPEEGCDMPQELCYWRREPLVYQSEMLAALPEPIHAPRCYGVSQHADGNWIWLEDIQESADTDWSLEQFQRAARRLGQFAGAYLTGTPIPNFPWLCGSLFRAFYADGDWWARFTDPTSANNAWQRSLVQAVYPEALRARVLRIWSEKREWIAANERLPQVFCHNDAHRRNLLWRQDAGQEALVAIDWAFCGPGGLGNDLGELIGTSLSYFAFDPSRAGELETAVLAGYISGLRDAGWEGDTRLARLGYLIALALYWGGTLPCEVALAQPGESRVNVEAKYGRSLSDILPGWRQLAEFALDRADEARRLMGQF